MLYCPMTSGWLSRLRSLQSSSAMDPSVSLADTSASVETWNHQLSNEKPLTVLEGREWLRQSMQPEALRIAGVTFEGRQELIARLQPGMHFLPPTAVPEHLPESQIIMP